MLYNFDEMALLCLPYHPGVDPGHFRVAKAQFLVSAVFPDLWNLHDRGGECRYLSDLL